MHTLQCARLSGARTTRHAPPARSALPAAPVPCAAAQGSVAAALVALCVTPARLPLAAARLQCRRRKRLAGACLGAWRASHVSRVAQLTCTCGTCGVPAAPSDAAGAAPPVDEETLDDLIEARARPAARCARLAASPPPAAAASPRRQQKQTMLSDDTSRDTARSCFRRGRAKTGGA